MERERLLSRHLFRREQAEPPPSKEITRRQGSSAILFCGGRCFRIRGTYDEIVPSTSAVYAERVYNYRLSRARRVVKNAFGMIANRFRILHRPQDMEPEGVKVTVMTMAVLHNFLISKSKSYYMAKGQVDW